MKRLLALFALLWVWNASGPAGAQETPENELALVRQLRAKGWNELARTRIEMLLKGSDSILNAALPLELARVNIAEARQKDPEQRFALFTTARGQLVDFINKNQGKVEAAHASAELARLTSYHAQAILSKAMREEEVKVRHEKARPAEAMFIQAGQDLDAAIKALDAALANPANANLKKTLAEELNQTRFDTAINIYDQARTYIDRSKDAVNEARAKTMAKARDTFVNLRSDESSDVGWLANAWLMKCSMELTIPDDVNKYYDFILKRKDDKSVQPAYRLVRYFHLQDITLRREDAETIGNYAYGTKPKVKKMSDLERIRAVQKEGEAWLKAYPSYHKTYEGQGVLFEVGYAHMTEAYMTKDKKTAGTHFDIAVKKFDGLADMDGDLADRARLFSMSIKSERLDTKAELKTFDEFMMKAMIERRKVIKVSQQLEDPKLADKKKLEDSRKQHLKDAIAALNKALALATPSTPVAKVDDARYYLCGAYLANGDPFRAAIVAESLGRSRTTRRAPEGASTAIATYAALHFRYPKDDAIAKRLEAMAAFVLSPESQRTWSTDPVTSMAHYQLAMAHREAKPKEAIAHLENLKADFVDYIYTQGQLVFIAQDAREKTEDKKEQAAYIAAAKAAINRMTKFNAANDSPSVITMYFFAKMEMPKFYYSEAIEDLNAKQDLKAIKKCNDMAAYIKTLQAELQKLPGKTISAENRERIEFSMNVLLKYADLGIAEVKFRGDAKDRFDEVLKATNTVVTSTLALAKKVPTAEKIRMKDFRVTGDILSMALRANVQKGNVDQGKAILDVLQRLSGEDPKDDARSGAAVAVLLNDIAGQVQRMKQDNDSALKTTKGNYTAFLDVIAKEFQAKGIDSNAAILLATAYKNLDYPGKAATMFGNVKAPASLDKPIPKKTGKEDDQQLEEIQKAEDEINRYWAVRLEYIRMLRASKDKNSFKTAEDAAKEMIKHPNGRFQVQAMMEKNLLIEARADQPDTDTDKLRYREAFAEWKKFLGMPNINGVNLANKDVQKIRFTGHFYYSRVVYKLATKDPGIKDRSKYITAAAKMIVDLETARTKEGWEIAEPLYKELFKDKDYDSLKKEYDRLKALEKGASMRAPHQEVVVEFARIPTNPPRGELLRVPLRSPGDLRARNMRLETWNC